MCDALGKCVAHATTMADEQRRYLSYLLRLWQISSEGKWLWRASLENPHTGERHGFADLKSMFAFLEEQTYSPSQPPSGLAQ